MRGQSPVQIIVDTREQQPYSFDAEGVEVVRKAIPNGDYSLQGFDFEIAVERKSLDDFAHTVIKDRERFRRELRALQDYRAACIVVEGSLSDVRQGQYASGAHPNAIWSSALSITVDWGIPVYFCGTRQLARQFTEEWLMRWWYRLEREGAHG